jgi:hypothetical protein
MNLDSSKCFEPEQEINAMKNREVNKIKIGAFLNVNMALS